MKFTINRKTWRCGDSRDTQDCKRGKGPTLLLNDSGFQCCLGQICSQLGATSEQLRGISAPRDLAEYGSDPRPFIKSLTEIGLLVPGKEATHGSPLVLKAVQINDQNGLTVQEREQRLTSLFKKHGHQLEFVGRNGTPECKHARLNTGKTPSSAPNADGR